MTDTSSREESNEGKGGGKKVTAAYAAIVPFLLAEAILLVLAYTGFDADKTFIAIVFGANIVIAILIYYAVVAGGRQRR